MMPADGVTPVPSPDGDGEGVTLWRCVDCGYLSLIRDAEVGGEPWFHTHFRNGAAFEHPFRPEVYVKALPATANPSGRNEPMTERGQQWYEVTYRDGGYGQRQQARFDTREEAVAHANKILSGADLGAPDTQFEDQPLAAKRTAYGERVVLAKDQPDVPLDLQVWGRLS